MLYALIFMLLLTVSAKAQHDTTWVQQLNANVLSCAEAKKSEALSIFKNLGISQATTPASEKTMETEERYSAPKTIERGSSSLNVSGKYPRLLVFVSASESKVDLKRLAQDLQKMGGRMVIRGLVENNMLKTQAWTQEVGSEILIDPTLFKAFHITRVPTFVLTEKTFEEAEDTGVYDQITGNITLDYALERFAQKGDVQDAPFLSMLRKDVK